MDDKSFFLIPWSTIDFYISKSGFDAWRYYHTDQRLASENDEHKRCALGIIDKAIAEIVPHQNQKTEADNKAYAERSKIAYTDYVKNYQSQRNDPALNKAILGWWQRIYPDTAASFPILQIKIMNPSWVISRNEYGIVTHKMSSAMYIYKSKKDNTCYAQWQSFKYEALGAGVFDTELQNYSNRLNTGQPDRLELTETQWMESGSTYEVDCAAFTSVPLR